MDNIIKITELQNVEAVAMKYIVENLGFNIRPCAAVLDDEGLLKIPLKAVVPRQVTKRDSESKVFIYHLDEIGHIIYKKCDSEFEFISGTTAKDIEGEITKRFTNLTETIEKEILQEGKMNWGRLSFIQTFLRPLYMIIDNLVSSPNPISLNSLEKENQWRWANLLVKENYAQIDKDRPQQLIPTNKLTMAFERYYSNNHITHNFTEIIVGGVFANRYMEIKKDFKISNPTAYVDATKIYYFDALRYGENIPIHEEDLFYEYLKIGDRELRNDTSIMRFRTLLSELESVNLLEKKGRYINGKQTFFDNLMNYRDEILEGSVEAPRIGF